ncbi:MAG: hypothetical protein CBD21_04425 [bacterium TMED161]|nr:MAG: hypothetical protein CBD21_04425 [bacterium TMED161]|tara:strand:+ start:1049 stop:1285 length:237 start_codon:yes stop_codon:yes gene_type:complete
MCGRRPSPPPLPEPEPVDSPIEQTADRVVVGEKRKQGAARRRRGLATLTGRRRLGTRSLQIPLLSNSMQQGSDLNYPV